MKRITFVLFFLMSCHEVLFAEKATGIIEEFTKLEEHYRNPPQSEEYRKKTLERNLMSALRISLIKKYVDYEVVLKDLNQTTLNYEIAQGTFNCYVRYKQHYLFFMFAMDPSLYIQTPIEERFYLKPEDLSLAGDPSHQNDQKQKQDPKTPAVEKK